MSDIFISWLSGAFRSDMFAGGLALGAIGLAFAILRSAASSVLAAIRRRIWVSVSFDNRTEVFHHFYEWLDGEKVLAHVRRLRATPRMVHSQRELLVPAPGLHWFVRDGRLCLFERKISDRMRAEIGRQTHQMETLTISVLFGTLDLVRGWIAQGAALAEARQRVGPGIHVYGDGCWQRLGEVRGRLLASVLCDDDRVERLLGDLRRFLGARAWYEQRGVPWRRGYLLHGPPGTGKSSTIRALASELQLNLALLDLSNPALTDDELREALATVPRNAIIVIEDADAVFSGREAGKRGAGISFSGLLNAIDGVAAQEGRALFLTTNHWERLDPALIRPGRVDREVEMGPVGAEAAARLFARFFPGETALATRFAENLGPSRHTPAALQGWLLRASEDPVLAASASGLLDRSERKAG